MRADLNVRRKPFNTADAPSHARLIHVRCVESLSDRLEGVFFDGHDRAPMTGTKRGARTPKFVPQLEPTEDLEPQSSLLDRAANHLFGASTPRARAHVIAAVTSEVRAKECGDPKALKCADYERVKLLIAEARAADEDLRAYIEELRALLRLCRASGVLGLDSSPIEAQIAHAETQLATKRDTGPSAVVAKMRAPFVAMLRKLHGRPPVTSPVGGRRTSCDDDTTTRVELGDERNEDTARVNRGSASWWSLEDLARLTCEVRQMAQPNGQRVADPEDERALAKHIGKLLKAPQQSSTITMMPGSSPGLSARTPGH